MINRARLDPQGEANRLGISLNAGLPGGTISSAAKQPLAFNGLLIDSARAHSDWMLSADVFSHTGQGGSDPGDRMRDAGYRFTGSWTWGENISWRGTTGQVDQSGFSVTSHEGLFRSAGHRENMLKGSFEEIGLGIRTGQFTSGNTFNALMVTQNYAKSGDKLFVTGVAYKDSDGDDLYSPGEGRGGVRVAFDSSSGPDGSTTTFGSGGYQQLVESGQLLVTFSGGGLARTLGVTVDVGSQNVKIDRIGSNTIASSADATAGQNLVGLELLGTANLDATGNSLANRLVGNKGGNTLAGGSGNDRLEGGAGNDRLEGGAGTDTAIYLGSRSNYQISESGSGHTVRANSGSEGTDTLLGIERVQFADQTVTLGSTPPPLPNPNPGGGTKGTNGADSLVGTQGADTIDGRGGNDRLEGRVGGDRLLGGDGADAVYGGSGNDRISGGGNNDRLFGGDGNDRLSGQGGNDLVDGVPGTDTVSFGGRLLDFTIARSGSSLTVKAKAGISGGVDTLLRVEKLAFSDTTVDAASVGDTLGVSASAPTEAEPPLALDAADLLSDLDQADDALEQVLSGATGPEPTADALAQSSGPKSTAEIIESAPEPGAEAVLLASPDLIDPIGYGILV